MLFTLFLLLWSFSVQAEIFQWFDAEGNANFSDKPNLGAKTLQVNAGHTFYQLKKVYDGDTVLLTNGKKVRFLGVNTPEVEGRNKVEQAGGEAAKQWLLSALKNKKIRLEKDVEKRDKYGRLLAYVFTEDNVHINLQLLNLGLASLNIYPPNLKYSEVFLQAEQQAEQHRLGIWDAAEYAPRQAEDIKTGRFKGWQRVVGRVKNVRHSRRNSYLNLTDNLALKIDKKVVKLFPKLESYTGKSIEVRGWIRKYKKRYSMILRHPSSIKILKGLVEH